MSGFRTMSLNTAVAVLTMATFIGWKSALAASASADDQAMFCGTIVEPLGYLCAEYRTYSADGYELVMHRIGSRRRGLDGSSLSQTKETDRPSRARLEAISASSPSLGHDQVMIISEKVPVLIMHQEFLNGESWFQLLDAGDKLFPLLLADEGFDVWIGHERATYWGHGHLSLLEDDKVVLFILSQKRDRRSIAEALMLFSLLTLSLYGRGRPIMCPLTLASLGIVLSSNYAVFRTQRYWDWTWDEQAKYDVPALLELINSITGFAAHFVGISQSATVGAAAATMLESSKFMRSLTLIGPTIYRGFSSPVLEAWAFVYGNTIDRTYYNEGHQNGAFNFSEEFNLTSVTGQGTVGQELGTISGPNCCLGPAVIPFTNGWDGTTSYKNLIHYQQDIRTNSWRRYDYGDRYNNTHAYGVPFPPYYVPEQIPSHIPILVVYGGQDAYAPLPGMWYLLSRLGTRSKSVFVPAYAHYDLFYSVNRTQDVFNPILQFLEAHRW